tara:strand:+ start:1973 stop:3019 length:1047 start_codon:yes stop_codon:yes gene_type:complete
MPIPNKITSPVAKTFMNPKSIPLEFQRPILSLDAFNNVYTGRANVGAKYNVNPNLQLSAGVSMHTPTYQKNLTTIPGQEKFGISQFNTGLKYTFDKGGYVKKYYNGGDVGIDLSQYNSASSGSYSWDAPAADFVTADAGNTGGGGPNMGNVSSGLSAVSSIASALDNDPNSFGAADTIGTVAQFASMGAAAGPIGAGVGALVGGVVSIFKKRQQDKANAKAERERKKKIRVAEKKEHLSSIQDDRMAEAESSAKAQGELLATAKSLSSTSAGKYFYNKGGMTQGAYNHSTNPLTVVDKYGNNTGMELTGGEGVFDKPAMNRIKAFAKGGNFQQLGQFVSNEMQTWKHK